MKNKIFKITILFLFVVAVGFITILKIQDNKNTEVVFHKSPVIVKTQLPKLLDLGAHSCVPCKMMMPILDTLREVHDGKLEVEFIDVWQDREAGARYGIRSIPTQIIYDAAGNELFRHEGFWSREDMENKMNELGISLGDNS